MNVLVTGGAGYIGSHTVRQLVAAGHRVVVLDSLELGHANAVSDAELVVGNIDDSVLVTRICSERNITQLVHFAAYKAVGESMQNPLRYWRNNVHGTATLVQAAADAGVRNVVFSSSCSVYGNPPMVPVDESAPIAPESVYADTKAMSERILQWYDTTRGVTSVSLRYFNAAGASFDGRIGEDWEHAANLIPLVMKATLGAGPPVQVFGTDYPTPDGTGIRDYIHVDDLARAHVLALGYLADGGTTTAINVGTGHGSSVRDVIAATEAASGRRVPFVDAPRRVGDPITSFANASRAAAVLGWEASYSLRDIIETAWAWHSANPTGYPTSSR